MKRFLINGGEFNNKGAEAMTFVAISNIIDIYPDKEYIVKALRNIKIFFRTFTPGVYWVIRDSYQFMIYRYRKSIPSRRYPNELKKQYRKYFGEMTFTNGSGFEGIFPEKYEYKLGDLIPLPTDKKRVIK